MMDATRDQITGTLIKVIKMELPRGITEADRRAKLAHICPMTNVTHGESAWRAIWADVMAMTGCKMWNEIMNEGKH
jgi:hypothetical protein